MQVKEHYDLIVIGDQLSGLFLAAGAAQAGKSVLVLEESALAAVAWDIGSGKLQGDFFAEPLIGLSHGNELDLFFRSLGLYQDHEEIFPAHDPGLQVVGKGFRGDFVFDAMDEHLAREFPLPQRAAVAALLGGGAGKGSFSRAVAQAGLPVDFELFGWMQAALYGSVTPRDISYESYKAIAALAAESVRYVVGGRSALKERLLARVMAFGGSVKRATRVEEIVFERGRLSGVLLSSYEGFVRSSMVVGAMGARTFLHLVPDEHRPSRLAAAVQGLQPRFWRMSVSLVVAEESLPEGLGSHSVVMDLAAGEFVQLQLFPASAYRGIPERHRLLVARSLVPFQAETLGERAVAREIRLCLARVEAVAPFLRERDLQVVPDPARLREDPIFPRYYSFASADHIPPISISYEEALSPSPWQNDFLDWSRFGLPGLALCSRDIYPLLGLAGEARAAVDALALVRKRDGQ